MGNIYVGGLDIAENKTITIFSQKMAGYLMQKGFVLVDIGKNVNQPRKNVFFFNHSVAIDEAMADYKNIRK